MIEQQAQMRAHVPRQLRSDKNPKITPNFRKKIKQAFKLKAISDKNSQYSIKIYSRLRLITPNEGLLRAYVDSRNIQKLEKLLAEQISVGIELIEMLHKF